MAFASLKLIRQMASENGMKIERGDGDNLILKDHESFGSVMSGPRDRVRMFLLGMDYQRKWDIDKGKKVL